MLRGSSTKIEINQAVDYLRRQHPHPDQSSSPVRSITSTSLRCFPGDLLLTSSLIRFFFLTGRTSIPALPPSGNTEDSLLTSSWLPSSSIGQISTPPLPISLGITEHKSITSASLVSLMLTLWTALSSTCFCRSSRDSNPQNCWQPSTGHAR